MRRPFVIIGEEKFYVGDWIRDRKIDSPDPSVIVNVFKDESESHVIIKSPFLGYEMMELSKFIKRVRLKIYRKVIKPKFAINQKFKNKYTESTIEIIDVPHKVNEREGEYSYYVLDFTPTFGYNYTCMLESEIEEFFKSEGVVKI